MKREYSERRVGWTPQTLFSAPPVPYPVEWKIISSVVKMLLLTCGRLWSKGSRLLLPTVAKTGTQRSLVTARGLTSISLDRHLHVSQRADRRHDSFGSSSSHHQCLTPACCGRGKTQAISPVTCQEHAARLFFAQADPRHCGPPLRRAMCQTHRRTFVCCCG